MSRDAVSKEVDHQDSAGDKQHTSFSVEVMALSTLDIAGDCPGQVGHTLYSQLFREVLLRRERQEKQYSIETALSSDWMYFDK